MNTDNLDPAWVTDACRLPTTEQPLRVAEFDDLFAQSVRAVERVGPASARLLLDADAADRARELAERERACCSFFSFNFSSGGPGTVALRVTVPGTQVEVLDALTARAAAIAGRAG